VSDSDTLTPTQMETYGIDWQSFEEPAVVQYHLHENDLTEDMASWEGLAEAPPLDRMNTVAVPEPSCSLNDAQITALFNQVVATLPHSTMVERGELWRDALAFVHVLSTNF